MAFCGQELLGVASARLQSGEDALTYGPVRWDELARMFPRERHAGQGLMIGTDRRLVFWSERSAAPTTLLYSMMDHLALSPGVLGAELEISVTDGRTVLFYGKKKLMRSYELVYNSSIENGLPTPEQTSVTYRRGDLSLKCARCPQQIVQPGWSICPACGGVVAWDACAEEVANLQHALTAFREHES